jgi:hypothetical protein
MVEEIVNIMIMLTANRFVALFVWAFDGRQMPLSVAAMDMMIITTVSYLHIIIHHDDLSIIVDGRGHGAVVPSIDIWAET